MKRTNTFKRVISFTLILAIIITMNPVYSRADSDYELLYKCKEKLNDEYDEWSEDFYIDHFGVLKLVFFEEYTYGQFNVRVIDEDDEDIFDKTISMEYENYVCEITIPEGSYSISVTAYEEDTCFYLKAYFKEMSDVTYSELAKKAKSKAGKNITFDTIDAGNHGRLYGLTLYGYDDTHIASQLYSLMVEVQPYIDIQKKGNYVYTKLKIKGKGTILSAFNDSIYYDKIVFTSDDYRLAVNIKSTKTSDKYNYSSGIYTSVCKTDTTLSSSDKIKESDIEKLINLLEDKNARIKFVDSGNDGYFYMYLSDKSCKNWVRMIKIYQQLLELYD